MSDGQFPAFEEMSEERQRAHLFDAHGLGGGLTAISDSVHDRDHEVLRPSRMVPHEHSKPPTVAEQAKAALRGAFAARAVMEEVVNELDRLGFLRAPHKGDGDA